MVTTAWDQVATRFRQAWERRHGGSGRHWGEAEPGYRYGYEMSRDPRYHGRAWDEVEPELRADHAGWARRQGYGQDAGGWNGLRGDVREAWEMEHATGDVSTLEEGEQTLELREEQLVPHKEMREVGQIQIRTEVEEIPGRLEVEALREEVEVEHVPIGQVVSERVPPWEEDGVLYVPLYEEQLVMVKRLVLREHLKIRRVGTTETRLFEDTLRRDRLVVEDPDNTGLVHERFPTDSDR
ncbi:MAG: YsnF/AvaK domain-containing protein [Chloroflexi bacterium]|nr:YsnF/AvaK domain-containing protein [Chloroflexota bacterium]